MVGVGGNGVVRQWVRGGLIGAGSFGIVNLALNTENGNLMAVKSVECDESASSSEHRALKHEIAMLQSIDCAHVVQHLGSSRSLENGKQMLNLFLEYMPGGSLADTMKRFGGFLNEALIRTYTRDILEGLHYLHTNGIVHCDVKCRNILVGCSGVKLADLGSARRLAGGGGGEKSEVLMSPMKGTPLWMAPEVVRQEEQGTPSDIWSLGCTILEMATGKAPWPNLSSVPPLVALFHIGCVDEVPQMPASLSSEAHDFLRNCFCRNPSERWNTSQLLQHPFVTQKSHASPDHLSSHTHPPSPDCVLDLTWNCKSQASSLILINSSIALLSLITEYQRFHEVSSGGAAGERPKEQCHMTITESNSLLWGSSPLTPKQGQWIVVHSPDPCSSDGTGTSSSQHPSRNVASQDARLTLSYAIPMDFISTWPNSSCSLLNLTKDAKLQHVSANAEDLESSSCDHLQLSQRSTQPQITTCTITETYSLLSQTHIQQPRSTRQAVPLNFYCYSNSLSNLIRTMRLFSHKKMRCFIKVESFDDWFEKGRCIKILSYIAPFQELMNYSRSFVKWHSFNKKRYKIWVNRNICFDS